jgi:hypothetical protein
MLVLRMNLYTPITTDYYCNSMLILSTKELTRAIGTKSNRLPLPPYYIHTTLRQHLKLLSPLKPKPKTQAETPQSAMRMARKMRCGGDIC